MKDNHKILPEEKAFLKKWLAVRNSLFELVLYGEMDSIPPKVMDAIYIRGLDGNRPDDDRRSVLWTKMFFRGRVDPIDRGYKVIQRWMNRCFKNEGFR